MRVHQIAKAAGTTSPITRDVLARLGIKTKSPSTLVPCQPIEAEALVAHVRAYWEAL